MFFGRIARHRQRAPVRLWGVPYERRRPVL